MMADIFISYKSQEKERVRPLAKLLEEQGWSVWWDRKIPPGKQFDVAIDEALKSVKCVVVIWTKVSVKSTWVKIEASEGLRKGILVPVMLDDVEVPLEFRHTQAAPLINWPEKRDAESIDLLIESIGLNINKPPSPVPKEIDWWDIIKKWLTRVLLVLLLMLIAFGLYKALRSERSEPYETGNQPPGQKSPEPSGNQSNSANAAGSNQPGNQTAANRQSPVVINQTNAPPPIIVPAPVTPEQGAGDVASELRAKGLIPRLQQAHNFARSGNSQNKEEARKLYVYVVGQLTPGAQRRLDQTLLRRARTAQDIDEIISSYRALFDKYL